MKNTIVNIATFISLSLSAPMQASIFNFFSSDDKSEEKQQVVTQETPSQANPQLAYTADNSDPLIAAGRNQMPPCDRSRDNSALSNGNEGINYAKLLTRTFSNVAKKAIPSVVFIKTEVPAEADYGQMNPFADDFFYRFFGGTPPKQRNQPYNTPPMQIAQGSGFIITKDGYIMTNYHVVKDSTKITVDLNDKENSQYEAEFVGGDPQTDIALIKITGKEDFPYLELEDINNVEVGEWAIAIGNPFDLEASVTVGVVSAKGRNDLQISALEDFLQTDAAIYPGNSGGPLLNLDGNVIGMNTAILTNRGNFIGIGFAIPSSILGVVKDQLIQNGIITRGYIGVLLQDVEPNMINALQLDKARGAIVTQVMPDSPAAQAGLQQGDVILEINDQIMKDRETVRNAIAILPQGSVAQVKISRLGKVQMVDVAIGKNDQNQHYQMTAVAQKLGLQVQNLNSDLAAQYGYKSDDTGVIVTEVRPGSISYTAKMRPGMLIKNVNHEPVTNVDDFNAALEKTQGKNVFILANDRGRHIFISLSM